MCTQIKIVISTVWYNSRIDGTRTAEQPLQLHHELQASHFFWITSNVTNCYYPLTFSVVQVMYNAKKKAN